MKTLTRRVLRLFSSPRRDVDTVSGQDYPRSTSVAHPPALGGRSIELDPLDSLGLTGGGDYEPSETALCKALATPGQRCLDVGANIGYFTLLLSELCGPDGHVTAFEPDPKNFAILSRNCAREVTEGRITLKEAALGKCRLHGEAVHEQGQRRHAPALSFGTL